MMCNTGDAFCVCEGYRWAALMHIRHTMHCEHLQFAFHAAHLTACSVTMASKLDAAKHCA